MNSPQTFDDFYRVHKEKQVSSSLLSFFQEVVRPRLNQSESILEIGCGNYSLFEECKLNANITAIDFSAVAIDQAPKSNIIYQMRSITDENFFSEGEFDLIFDSHCMNCLVQHWDRERAFNNIFKTLKNDGLFAGEFMVQPINGKVEIPLKMIKSARELEEEILSHKFKIIYFMISKDSSFVNEVNGEKIFCDVLRVIAKKD